jgi:parvulin-like peptidyl-prolyl isomerase
LANDPVEPVRTPPPAPTPVATAAPAEAAAQSPQATTIIARLNGSPITLDQVEPTLIEGYGLNVLLNIVQLEYVKRAATTQKINVTPQDITTERERSLAKLFPDADKAEYPVLFQQLLQDRHISQAEFDLVIQTNTYLRKMAEPVKEKISEENVQEAFREIYGETIQVRHIQTATLPEILKAKSRVLAGESFAKVAQEISQNVKTAPLGGELEPFSRSARYPQAFKDAAFALKEGEISDPINVEGAYHILQLERRFAPKVVKYDDVKDAVRERLTEQLVQTAMDELRKQMRDEALRGLIIDLPVLKAQYDARIHQRDQQIRETNQVREQFERERARILQSATQPAGAAGALPPDQPVAPEVARPPATQP